MTIAADLSEDRLAALEDALGHGFADRAFLVNALTHSSYAHEAAPEREIDDNERLEFLGDSVLGFLVGELIFTLYPDFREGELSKARSHLVSMEHFASLARRLGLGDLLRLAPSESRAGGPMRDSLLADTFEALFAALYLDGGLAAARRAAERLFSEDVAALDPAELLRRDSKTALQERAQAEGKPLPVYRLVEESGLPHEKLFVYEVALDDLRALGVGASKKEAQREAAKELLMRLGQ